MNKLYSSMKNSMCVHPTSWVIDLTKTQSEEIKSNKKCQENPYDL